MDFDNRWSIYALDFYHRTSPFACIGFTVHCRSKGNGCGIGAQLESGPIARWKECPVHPRSRSRSGQNSLRRARSATAIRALMVEPEGRGCRTGLKAEILQQHRFGEISFRNVASAMDTGPPADKMQQNMHVEAKVPSVSWRT